MFALIVFDINFNQTIHKRPHKSHCYSRVLKPFFFFFLSKPVPHILEFPQQFNTPKEVTAYPVQFSTSGSKIFNEICANDADTKASLNIKRGM